MCTLNVTEEGVKITIEDPKFRELLNAIENRNDKGLGLYEAIVEEQKQKEPITVIRCKDCKYCGKPCLFTQRKMPGVKKCNNHNAPSSNRLVWGKDYCSYAKSREGAEQ